MSGTRFKLTGERTTVVAASGDSWDLLALKHYGDGNMTGVLMDANPGLCGLLLMEGGEQVTIPGVDMASSQALPPWKRGSEA